MANKCVVCGKTDAQLLQCGRCRSRGYCGRQCQKEDWPTHKAECMYQNYILKVDLLPRFITNPRITRTLSCPANSTFAALHQALLVAFGWANTHLYDFDVFDHSDARGRENILSGPNPITKITDLNTIDDFDSYTPTRDSSKLPLFKVLDNPKTKGKTIHYNYDLGDNWEHVIICIGRAEATVNFVCLEGEGHGCAEDVGGHRGWRELLTAYDAQDPTEDQKERMTWFETSASNKDPKGLRGELKWQWDQDRINAVLRELGGVSRAPRRSSNSLPSVLLISLGKLEFFDEMYLEVITKLRSRADMTEVTHISSAMQKLSSPQDYAAVIVTDPEVMENDFIAVQRKLVGYADSGGTVILGFHFSSFAHFDKLDLFFKNTWGLDWKSGDYTRSTFSLNSRANSVFMSRQSSLPRQYSMKALHLRDTKLEDRIYVENPNSTQSPAIFAKYGKGYLGWIGDVNTETGTTELLLTMCGV